MEDSEPTSETVNTEGIKPDKARLSVITRSLLSCR